MCDNGTLWVLGGDFCQSLHSTFACGNVSLLETILCTDLNNIQSLLESISPFSVPAFDYFTVLSV